MVKEMKKRKTSQRARAARVPYVDFAGIRAGRAYEYIMPVEQYNDLVYECTKNKLGDVHKYLCDFVNEQRGILGTCVKVIPA